MADRSRTRVRIDDQIAAQLTIRGWTEDEVHTVVARGPVGTSTDNTGDRPEPATVYGSRFGGYLVINDVDGHVVQVSDKTDTG